jgi:hypothetical protein
MEPKDTGTKLSAILEAIASGNTCEQILAADRSLTYHDIFHAVAEAPTNFWNRPRATGEGKSEPPAIANRAPWRQRTD